jgi:2,4-dienoyl-CoA reductase-like NADH-dependent reductase (Old Yellow Enzyme family)
MQAAGLDGIELQAYGHLIDQFYSPFTNDWSAPYGGSLENRMRFGFEVLDAIRKRVGDEFIIGVRYTADEAEEGGITPEEGLKIAHAIIEDGRLDEFKKQRYSSFDSGIGAKIEAGEVGLEELSEYTLQNGEPQTQSGRQEMLENLINDFI